MEYRLQFLIVAISLFWAIPSAHAECYRMDYQGAPMVCNNQPSNSEQRSSVRNEGDTSSQIIQQSGEALIELFEKNDSRRQTQQDEEQRQLQQEKMLRQQQERYKFGKAQQDQSLNPWSEGPKFVRGAAAQSPAATPTSKVGSNISNTKPKDPNQNYAGKSCEYFTRPSDEAHLNYHSDGTVLSYGNNVYKCESRHWRLLTTRDKYWAPTERLDASWFEGGSAE